jgi:hypothetical protein
MQLVNAITKLNKLGFKVINSGNRYKAKKDGLKYVIEFITQDELIMCIRARRENDLDDSQSDYSAGMWCNNLAQAIRLAH